MRNQKSAELDVRSYFPTIVGSKQKKTRTILRGVQAKVMDLCDSYDDALDDLSTPKEQIWTKDERGALQSCYGVKTKVLSKHKDNILAALKAESEVNVQRCAYCMLSDPRTWDHYLPKESFPEYSVYHSNLLYICFGCNHRKSTDFDEDNLLFCHPYFTVDSAVSFLHCQVTIVGGKLAIKYYCAGAGDLQVPGQIAQRHLERLGLITRFAAEASSMVSGLIGELRQHFPGGVSGPALIGVLERRYAEAQERLGINAWDSRLWHGLAHCAMFLGYANEKITAKAVPHANGFYEPAPLAI